MVAGFEEPGPKQLFELGGQGEVRWGCRVLPEGLRKLELVVEGELQREAGEVTLRHGSSVLHPHPVVESRSEFPRGMPA